MGTRFVVTRECSSPDWYKEAIIRAQDSSTMILGEAMPIRVLKNIKAEKVAHPDKVREKNGWAGGEEAYVAGDADEAIMPAGQVASLIKELKGISDIFPDMVREAGTIIARLSHFFREDTL